MTMLRFKNWRALFLCVYMVVALASATEVENTRRLGNDLSERRLEGGCCVNQPDNWFCNSCLLGHNHWGGNMGRECGTGKTAKMFFVGCNGGGRCGTNLQCNFNL